MARRLFIAGTICCALSLLLSALSAHFLKETFTAEYFANFKTGVHYQFLYGLVLILIAHSIMLKPDIKAFIISGWSFLVGIICFSGSLYLLAITEHAGVTLITPVGGIALSVGWIAFIIGAWKS